MGCGLHEKELPKFLNILSDICESSGGCANSPSLSHSFPFCDSKPSSLALSPPPSAASDLKTHHVRPSSDRPPTPPPSKSLLSPSLTFSSRWRK
ncbi:hypothetical protein ACFXTO_038964 [Malus domestica]